MLERQIFPNMYVERPQVEWPGATRLDNTEFDGKIN